MKLFDGSSFDGLINGGQHILVCRLIWRIQNTSDNGQKVAIVHCHFFEELVVDVIVTSEFIHPYIICIVPRCLFWDVSVM